MKTQISKKSYDAEKRYSGVYQQQGRMLTDADWNNLVDVLKEQLTEALKDVVGNGSPRSGALTVSNDRKIQPGDLYIDGLRAVLPGTVPIAASLQPDLPESGDLPATGPYVVYADVWDRSLTSIEDPGLRDAGLNGADTCTRTQTMLQIKTCATGVNPETDIPQKGNAALSLDLHENLETSDPCDPCAGLVGAGEGRVGNYLFRLEVHAVKGDAANPTGLTLKWSSENGAEQYTAQSEGLMPPGFVNSRYLYEFYNLTTEKHPGVHLTSGFTPRAGILKTTYEIPDGVSDPKDFVRRWDGYCELNRGGSTWTLADGWDKGVDLSTGIPAAQPGHVAVGPGLTVNLEAFLMKLELSGKTFVAGDYWLAPVREAVHSAGSSVCSGALPDGIEHHYLRLARVDGAGNLEAYPTVELRRLNFPPLTDLEARDVGYDPNCPSNLFDPNLHDTVEKALNQVCQIAAQHITYQTNCPSGLFDASHDTVKKALDQVCSIAAQHVGYQTTCDSGLFNIGHDTVKKALDQVCNITAEHVGFRTECSLLKDIATVEQALNKLCETLEADGEQWPQVKEISWKHDRPLPLGDLNKGLTVVFSEPMHPASASLDTFVVTIELPVFDPIVGDAFRWHQAFILHGKLDVQNHDQIWTLIPVPQVDEGVLGKWLGMERSLFESDRIRCRVVLKADDILDSKTGTRPLDGNAFGILSGDVDPSTGLNHTDLVLPSGDGRKGGDFESWFYLMKA